MDSSEYTRLKKSRVLATGTSKYYEDVIDSRLANGTILFNKKVVNQCCSLVGPGPGPGPGPLTNNSIVLNGYYSSGATIYNADGSTTITLPSAGAYVIGYDPSGTALWAARIGSTSDDQGYGCTTDSDKNVIVTGYYTSNPLPIYNSDGTQSTLSLDASVAYFNAYIVKYNPSGAALWAAHIAGDQNTDIYGVITDSSKHIIVTGVFYSNTVPVYNQDGTLATSLETDGGGDSYIVKYDPFGTVLWATHIGGTNMDDGYGVVIDANDNIVCTGNFMSDSITAYNVFGSSSIVLSRSGFKDAYIIKYNPTGQCQWAAHIGGNDSDTRGYSIAIDSSNNSIVTGLYRDTINIYNQDGSSTLSLDCEVRDAFVAKYDSTGLALWAARIGGSSDDEGRGVATDSSDNILVVGYYRSNVLYIYNQDGSSTFSLPNTGTKQHAYVIKYDATGTAIWATYIAQDTKNVTGAGITTDSDNNVLVTGYYNTQEDLVIPSTDSSIILLPSTGADETYTYTVKYNSAGVAQWATRITARDGSFNVNNIATS